MSRGRTRSTAARLTAGLAIVMTVAAASARAHETRPSYLELRQTSDTTFDVTWKVPARGDNLRLSLYVRFPETCEVVDEPQGRFAGGAYVERWTLRHAGGLVGETIHIDGLEATLTEALVRLERGDGSLQVERLMPTSPSMVVVASPTRWEATSTYVGIGIKHILGGVDHLLFVLGLLFLVGSRAMLVKTITSFTVAHSITLALATFGVASAPTIILNVLIALSILFLGPEIVRRHRGATSLTIAHPWIVAFAFGLLHGFGFASGLQELGLPAREVPLALLGFNVGVEIGQLGFVALLLVIRSCLATLEFTRIEWARPVPAYLIGTLGAFWAIDRTIAAIAA